MQIALAIPPWQHRALVRAGRLACWILLGMMTAWPLPIAWSEETPVPPTTLDEIPSAKREDVTRLLRKIRQRHGEDAIVIQTNLLLNAMQRGSILATGVRVDGVKESLGKRYLGFNVETGMVFDDHTRDQVARIQILWSSIVEPTLAHLKDGLHVKADGIMVQLQSYHREYRSVAELRGTIDRPGTSEEARFYVLTTDLDDVVRGQSTLRDLIARTRIVVDGTERTVAVPAADQVLAPGPD